jgi:acetyltransferase-like isoleucine patch superfamily enzyme
MLYKTIFNFAIRIRNALLTRWWNLVGRCLLNIKGIETKGSTSFYGLPIITLKPNSKIQLGKFVILCSDSRFTDLGVSRPVILRTLRPNALISIGSDTGLSGATICAAISVVIGSGCLLGADVQIFDTDFHKLAPENRCYDNSPELIKCAPVLIEDNVFIGSGSKVMKGVTIGHNSVIGAGSIVCKDIPPNSIAAGNPAKVIGFIN